MALNPLDNETIQKLLNRQDAKDKKLLQHSPVKWPNLPGRVLVLEAYRSGKDHVLLGKRIYGLKRRKVLGEDAVYIWPLDGKLIPCGDFRINTLEVARAELAKELG